MTQMNAIEPFSPTEISSGVFPVTQESAVDEYASVVWSLRQVHGQSLQATMEVGEIIFRHVFDGDVELLRARGRKCSSFRKLSSHPELKLSASSLWRAVAIYELSLRFPELNQYVHTGVAHVSVVLGLPPSDQFRLLRLTETQCWTRRKLQKVVTELRLDQREPNAVPQCKLLERLAGLNLLARDVSQDQRLELLDQGEAREALELLNRIREQCREVESRLHGVLAN